MSINETITIKDQKAAAEAREVQEEAREHNVSQNSVPSDIKGEADEYVVGKDAADEVANKPR